MINVTAPKVTAPKNRSFSINIDNDDFAISNINDHVAKNIIDAGICCMKDNEPFNIRLEAYGDKQITITSDIETVITIDGEKHEFSVNKLFFLSSLVNGFSQYALEWVLPPNYQWYKTQVSEDEYNKVAEQYSDAELAFKNQCSELKKLLKTK